MRGVRGKPGVREEGAAHPRRIGKMLEAVSEPLAIPR